jgi:hypothetical protein
MQEDDTVIEIPLSKRNLAFMLLGSAGFVALGLLMVGWPENFGTFSLSITIVRIVGTISALFFGTIGYFIGRRLLDDRMGLRIDARGITDHSSGVSVGLIEWADIQGLATRQVSTERFLVLRTDRPEKYIDRAPNAIARKAMQANHRMTGSPLNISARTLQISFEELVALIEEAWAQHRAA